MLYLHLSCQYTHHRPSCSHIVHVVGIKSHPSAADRLTAVMETFGCTVIELSKAFSENASSSTLQWWLCAVMRMTGNKLASCVKQWENLQTQGVCLAYLYMCMLFFTLPQGSHVCFVSCALAIVYCVFAEIRL